MILANVFHFRHVKGIYDCYQSFLYVRFVHTSKQLLLHLASEMVEFFFVQGQEGVSES